MEYKYSFLAGLDFESMLAVQVVEILARAGYRGVSWTLSRFDPAVHTPEDVRELVSITQAAGLTISEWMVQLDYIHPDAMIRQQRCQQTLDAIRLVAEQDAAAPVNLFSGPAPWIPSVPRLGKDLSEGQAWGMLLDVFDRLVPLAEGLGIRLAVEPVFGHLVHDYYTLMELLRQYDSSCLGVNFDPSHLVLYGNDIPWVIHQIGRRIFHVHLKDAAGKPGGLPGETFLFPLLGEGQVPWRAVYAALDQVGYRGFLTVEFESFGYYKSILKSDPAAAAELSMQLLKRLEN